MICDLCHPIRLGVLTLALGAMAMPAISLAQDGSTAPRTTPQTRPAHQKTQRFQAVERLRQAVDQLNLTDDQKTRARAIMDDARTQAQQLMQSDTTREEKQQDLRTLANATRQQLNALLTPEQKQKLRELVREQRGTAGAPATQPGTRGGPLQRMENIAMGLNLNADQKAKVQDLTKQYREQLATAISNSTGDRRAMAREARPIVQDYRSRLTQLLTPEQTEQFNKQVQAAFPGGRMDGQRAKGTGRSNTATSKTP